MELSTRALNRATLARQHLLRRAELSPVEAIGHLVGLQAQAPNAPYYGLWTRLASFTQADLTDRLYDRSVVRSSMLRGTQHLVLAADYRWLRPMIQPIGTRAHRAAFGRQTVGVDLDELAAAATELLRGRTLTRPELGRALAERWPDHEPLVLGWSAQHFLQLVHTPPNGTWGRGGATPFTLAADWLGPLEQGDPARARVELARRYLAAFGPATLADLQTWSGLTRKAEGAELAEALAELDLVAFTDPNGQVLHDLPDAPRPDPDTPAPVRFLPEFDNLVVGHADRTRLMTGEHRRRVVTGSLVRPTFLVDGFVAGLWELKASGDRPVLTLEEFAPVDRDALAAEAERLLAFAAPASSGDVRFGPVGR